MEQPLVFTATGTASGTTSTGQRVLFLEQRCSWSNASSANNWTNWTAPVALVPGTNQLSTYAADDTGNNSATNSVSFDFVVTNQSGVRALGLGNHFTH